MSEPRTIWAYDDGLNSPDSRTWSAMVPIGPRYHHDAVVRELVDALERARAFIHGPGDRCGPVLRHIDAALAKIAQEGK